MKLNEYFSSDLRSTLIYFVMGAAAGYVSFAINNPVNAFVSMVIILGTLTFILKYALKITSYKWFLTNGAVTFVFMWFIVWTVLFNMGVAV